MSWIIEAISNRAAGILSHVSEGLLEDGVGAGAPAAHEDLMKQAEATLYLLIESLDGEPRRLAEYWEAIGRSSADREVALDEVPDAPDMLKRAVWSALAPLVDDGEVPLQDLIDSMMRVDHYLGICRRALMRGYFSARDEARAARASRMEMLSSLAEVLIGESDDRRMYLTIVESISEITGLSRCSLLLFEEGKGLMPAASNVTDSLEVLEGLSHDEAGALERYLSGGEPAAARAGDGGGELDGLLERYRAPVALIVPVISDGRGLGLLLLDERRAGEFSDEQVRAARFSAAQAAVAIEKAGILKEMETRLRHIAAIGIVARTLPSCIDGKQQLKGLLEIATALVGADRGSILLPEEMFGNLEVAESTGASGRDAEGDRELEIARWVFDNGEAVVLGEGQADPRFGPCGYTAERASLTALLKVRDKAVGVITVSSGTSGGGYTGDDLELFENFAAQAAVSIENTQLYDRLQDTYLGTIGSLAAAIEARDPYTVGHSARVTKYAVAIAESMELAPEEVEELRLAGMLHDLGKIGVPDHILNKPGGLTEEEYSAIRMHPEMSMRIIEPLPHLGNIIPIIYNHHEHFDGSGYVDGKSGGKIPLGARVIAVADAFEAMTSDRPYRPALSREEAVRELRSNAGTQFDPEIVAVFTELLEETARTALD